MQRDFHKLTDGPFDLLVIGGGIYGSWIAYDAALRGLKVALVEQKDWAAGTSSASSKLIHGGLRYLEQGRLGLVRKSLEERRLLHELGPHRVRPMRFVLPLYAGDRAGRRRMQLGLWLYDRLAGARQPVPRRRFYDRGAVQRRYDFLELDGLKGAFTFGDCQTDDARFALELVAGAMRCGAVAVNYARAGSLLLDQRRVLGALVEDREGGGRLEVRAAVTACCAGPWNGQLLEQSRVLNRQSLPVRMTKGIHLVLPQLPTTDAFLIPASGRRVVFLVPWHGRTLLGTTDTDYAGSPAALRVESAEVAELLGEAHRVLRTETWCEADVIGSFAGLRTLRSGSTRDPADASREWGLEEPLERLIVPIGGKLTSARADAEIAVDRVLEQLGRKRVPSRTGEQPLPWCPGYAFDSWNVLTLNQGLALGLDEETAEGCQLRYGSQIELLYNELRRVPALARRIVADAPFCLGEVVVAVAHEMARTLEDVLRRRMPVLLVSRIPPQAVDEVAALVGRALGWSEARLQQEIASVGGRASGSAVRLHGTA